MASWLIDDRGRCWDTQSPELARSLLSSLTGEKLSTYAVKNLGFISVKEINGSSHIQLRPAVVKPIALAACLYWVGDRQRRLNRIAISFQEHQCRHRIFGSFQPAVAALAECVKVGQEDRSRKNSRQSLQMRDLPPGSPASELLQLWTSSGGAFDEVQLQAILHSVLHDRYFILEPGYCGDQLIIRDIGHNYRFFDAAWRARARGNRIEEMPDFCYGTWVADAYRRVLGAGEPQIDRIEAILDMAGAGLSRVRYTRVIVPFMTTDRRRLVLSTSAVHDIVEHVDGPGEYLGQVR